MSSWVMIFIVTFKWLCIKVSATWLWCKKWNVMGCYDSQFMVWGKIADCTLTPQVTFIGVPWPGKYPRICREARKNTSRYVICIDSFQWKKLLYFQGNLQYILMKCIIWLILFVTVSLHSYITIYSCLVFFCFDCPKCFHWDPCWEQLCMFTCVQHILSGKQNGRFLVEL